MSSSAFSVMLLMASSAFSVMLLMAAVGVFLLPFIIWRKKPEKEPEYGSSILSNYREVNSLLSMQKLMHEFNLALLQRSSPNPKEQPELIARKADKGFVNILKEVMDKSKLPVKREESPGRYAYRIGGMKEEGGVLHREDGPAIETSQGHKEWHINGKCHREDGPAIIRATGHEIFYLDGMRIESKNAWLALRLTRKLDLLVSKVDQLRL